MSNLSIPGPTGNGSHRNDHDPSRDEHRRAEDNRESRYGGRTNTDAILSEEECLAAIARLAQLVAVGVCTPAAANSMRASFREILQYHRSQSRGTANTLANGNLVDICRNDPKVLNLLEPLLSDDQIAWVLQRVDGGRDGSDDGDGGGTSAVV